MIVCLSVQEIFFETLVRKKWPAGFRFWRTRIPQFSIHRRVSESFSLLRRGSLCETGLKSVMVVSSPPPHNSHILRPASFAILRSLLTVAVAAGRDLCARVGARARSPFLVLSHGIGIVLAYAKKACVDGPLREPIEDVREGGDSGLVLIEERRLTHAPLVGGSV